MPTTETTLERARKSGRGGKEGPKKRARSVLGLTFGEKGGVGREVRTRTSNTCTTTQGGTTGEKDRSTPGSQRDPRVHMDSSFAAEVRSAGREKKEAEEKGGGRRKLPLKSSHLARQPGKKKRNEESTVTSTMETSRGKGTKDGDKKKRKNNGRKKRKDEI